MMEFDLSDLLKEAKSLEERIESLTPRKLEHDQSFRASMSNAAMVQEVPELNQPDASASGNVGFEQSKAPESFEGQTLAVARSLDPGVNFPPTICKLTALNLDKY
jgi:hypothetical protein